MGFQLTPSSQVRFCKIAVAIAFLLVTQTPLIALTATNTHPLISQFDTALLDAVDYDESLKLSEAMLREGKSNNDKELTARGLVRLAYIELAFGRWRNDWEKKLEEAESLLPIKPSIANAEYLMFRGNMKAKWQNDFENGMQMLKEANAIAVDLHDYRLLAMINHFQANLYAIYMDDTKALEHGYRARKFAQQLDSEIIIEASLRQLLYNLLASDAKQSAFEIATEISDINPMSFESAYVISLNGDRDRFNQLAKSRLETLLNEEQSPFNDNQIGQLYFKIAYSASAAEEDQVSLENYRKAVPYFERAGNTQNAAVCRMNSEFLKLTTGEEFQLEKVLTFLDRNGAFRKNERTRDLVARVLAEKGEFQLAWQWERKSDKKIGEIEELRANQAKRDAEVHWASLLRSQEQAEKIQVEELRAQRANWLTWMISVIGAAISCCVAFAFFTVRRQRDRLELVVADRTASLNNAKDRALKADRAKSEFLARMNHEIRSPLTAISCYCELLANKHQLDTDSKAWTNGLTASSRHLLELVDNVLELSQIEKDEVVSQPVDFDIEQLAKAVHGILEKRADEKKLQFDCPVRFETSPRVHGDEMLLRQVLINLISNAIKFTNEGFVTAEFNLLREPGADHHQLQVFVRDSGSGIPTQELQSVFEPFSKSSTNKTGEGNGLGLHICQRIIEFLGGDISLESDIGAGTTVSFKIPLAEAKSSAGNLANIEINEVRRDVRILVVDDQKNIRQAVSARIQALGFACQATYGIDQTISTINDWDPQIVLLDLRMPNASGFEYLRKIRERATRNTAIVAMTADATRTVQDECMAAGFDGFVTKPFDVKSVKQLTRQFLDNVKKTV